MKEKLTIILLKSVIFGCVVGLLIFAIMQIFEGLGLIIWK